MIKKRSFRQSQSGATMIEFAITLPLLVLVIFASIEFGMFMNAKSAVSRTASDAIQVAAAMPPGRLDASTPATQDAQSIPAIVHYDLGGLVNDKYALVVEELTALSGGGTSRQIVSDGDPSTCALPPSPDLAALGARHGERFAVLRLCVGWKGLATSGFLNARDMRETRVLPMNKTIPLSCKQLLELGENRDGIYVIDPDGTGPTRTVDARCDMTNGGWTMVAAQFEGNAVQWNNGTGAGYDPSLVAGRSFTFSSGQIPTDGTAVAFAINGDVSNAFRIPGIAYGTGDIDLDDLTGEDGKTYQLHRAVTTHHVGLDPDLGPLTTDDPEFHDCLVLDDMASAPGSNWWFCPNATDPAKRGRAYRGDRAGADAAAWTIWIR